MLRISMGEELAGWRENFVRACLAMTREGTRSRRFQPRGRIEAGFARCPNCRSDAYFVGEDLDTGALYDVARASFCGNCGGFKVLTDESNYKTYEPRAVLDLLKMKASLGIGIDSPRDKGSRFTFLAEPTPCPLCGGGTYSLTKDLGALDYYENTWTVCGNQYCDWPGHHSELREPVLGGMASETRTAAHRRQSVFISYNMHDDDFASLLFGKLEQCGIQCWYAPHHIRGGRTIREQVELAIRQQDRLLVVISNESMHSDWVQYEIAQARRRERLESRRVLFPLRIVPFSALDSWVVEDDHAPDLAREIKKYYIPDFNDWRSPDSFAKAFQGLLEDLERND